MLVDWLPMTRSGLPPLKLPIAIPNGLLGVKKGLLLTGNGDPSAGLKAAVQAMEAQRDELNEAIADLKAQMAWGNEMLATLRKGKA